MRLPVGFCLIALMVGTGFLLPSAVAIKSPACLPCPCTPLYHRVVPMCGGGGGGCQTPCPWANNPNNGDEFPAYIIDPNFIVNPCSASNPNEFGFQGPFPCGGVSWQDDEYPGNDPSQLISYQSSWLGKTGVLVCTSSSASSSVLAGCHADYKSATWSQGCWGYQCALDHPSGSDTLNIPLNYLGGYSVTLYVNSMNNGGSGYFADVYLDYWFHWSAAVGSSNLQDMEFMLFFQRDQSNCSVQPPITYSTTHNYFYGYVLGCPDIGHWDTYGVTDSFMQVDVQNALLYFGISTNKPAQVLGIDFGQEVEVGSMTAFFDSFTQNFCYTTTCPNANGQTLS